MWVDFKTSWKNHLSIVERIKTHPGTTHKSERYVHTLVSSVSSRWVWCSHSHTQTLYPLSSNSVILQMGGPRLAQWAEPFSYSLKTGNLWSSSVMGLKKLENWSGEFWPRTEESPQISLINKATKISYSQQPRSKKLGKERFNLPIRARIRENEHVFTASIFPFGECI